MYRLIFVFALSCLLLPAYAMSDTFRLAGDVVLEVDLPGERWQVSKEPAAALVDDVAEHMHHDLEDQGRDVSKEQVRKAAMKRLAANELFIRSDTGAHLEIDISPIESGQRAPSSKVVRASARYAGESMASEEGVSDASSTVSDFSLPGAAVAYRLDIDYVQHEKPKKFVGIIGFKSPYWLYFYGTDPLQDQRDAVEMEQIMNSLRFVSENSD